MKINAHLPLAWARSLAALTAIAVAAMLSSCAHLSPPEPDPVPEPAVAEKKAPPKPIKPPPPSSLYEWWGKDYVSHIEVSINEQKARFYSGDQMVGWTTVASGVHKYPTPTGSFAVTEKVQDKKSNLYGKIYNKNGKLVRRNAKMGVHRVPAGGRFKGAPMPYLLRLTNDGIGMHAGPIPRPGNRASHGCIRMPRNFAPILYRHVDIGTPVTIKGNGPTYASYVTKQRKSAPKPARTAVAKVDSTPTSTTATTVRTSGEAAPPQSPADAAPASTETAALPPPPTGVAGVPEPTPGQEPPPPSPATTITTVAPGMASVPVDQPTDAAPASPTQEPQAAPNPGVAAGPPTSPDNTKPAPAPSAGRTEPIEKQAPPSAPSPSMTGVSGAPAPSMGQTAPVESTMTPPAAAAPPVQNEG